MMEKKEVVAYLLLAVVAVTGAIVWDKYTPATLSIMLEGDARVVEDAADGKKKARGYLKAEKSPLQGTVEHWEGVGEKYKEKYKKR